MKTVVVLAGLQSVAAILTKKSRYTFILNKKPAVIILFIAFALSSCTHYYYVPAMQNVPLFREKDEYRISFAGGKGEESSSAEVQAAYAITNHIALMTNFLYAWGGNHSANHDWANGTDFDAAAGYFKPINTFIVFELYGGFGLSSQHHQYAYFSYPADVYTADGTSDLSLTKFFLQPSLGFTNKVVDVAFSTGISKVAFNEINDYSITYGDRDNLNILSQNKNSYLFEPAITLRVGRKFAKMQVQYVHSINLTNPDLNFERNHFSIGLYFSLAKKTG